MLFSAFFTAFYSTKLLTLTFFSKPRFNKIFLNQLSESDFRFKIPLFILSIFSIVSGYFFYELFIGYGSDLLNLNINLTKNFLIEQEYLFFLRKLLPLGFVFSGFLVYLFFYFVYNYYFNFLLRFNNFLKIFLP